MWDEMYHMVGECVNEDTLKGKSDPSKYITQGALPDRPTAKISRSQSGGLGCIPGRGTGP